MGDGRKALPFFRRGDCASLARLLGNAKTHSLREKWFFAGGAAEKMIAPFSAFCESETLRGGSIEVKEKTCFLPLTHNNLRVNILKVKISYRVEREEYHGVPEQRGVVTGCKPPCGKLWEVRPGARGMQTPSGFAAVTGF